METIQLKCHKTGRPYTAPVTHNSEETVVHAECPYCVNRGVGPILDDIQMRIEEVL